MKSNGSMNRIYRLVWNPILQTWVAVAETARGRGKSGRVVTALAGAVALLCTGQPSWAGPAGGQVVSGSAAVSQTGAAGQTVTTVQQASQNLSLTWQSFNVGAGERVNFVQPSASALAVNRILDTQGSQILGRLQANGQVWLINPNGVLFGRDAHVDVGSLVASTLDRIDTGADGGRRLSGGSQAAVVNLGRISAANGGHVALLGHRVANEGLISARLGTVALGAGNAVTLNFSGNRLLGLQVDANLLAALAANSGMLQADGGQVLMSAGARDSLLASVVNNSGVVEARTVDQQAGRIVLLGGMAAGSVRLDGTLDASAPAGGDGGFVETSAARVQVADGARVNTLAPAGRSGRWLVDPTDFTVAAAGGDITGTTLSANLATTDVELSSGAGKREGNGDVNINDPVSWSSNHVLTLTADNSVNVNADITALSNSPAVGLHVNTGTGSLTLADGVSVNLPNVPVSSAIALVINGTSYAVINRLGGASDAALQSLQGLKNDVDGLAYALGSDIDASATATWNRGAGFLPIGTADLPFAGIFNGLGHRISNLTINRPATDYVGLFGYASGATISDVQLVNASVRGRSQVGALAGYQDNVVDRSSASGTVTGAGDYTGGLVGYSDGVVSNSSASATVTGTNAVGGLVGINVYDSVTASHASGAVTGSGDNVGGLVGENQAAVTDSQASGTVNGSNAVGGLVGLNSGSISGGVATGAVTGVSSVGGLAGYNDSAGTIDASRAQGQVTATGEDAGGLVGQNDGAISASAASGAVGAATAAGGLVGLNGVLGTVAGSQASGSVNGDLNVGGLVGDNQGIVIDSRASGNVSGISVVGGLAGNNDGDITGGRATGTVTATADAQGLAAAGGLVGTNNGTVQSSSASGSVSATGGAVGGLVGLNTSSVIGSYATGVTGSSGKGVGGLVGENQDTVSDSYASGAVNGSDAAGGLVGLNGGSVERSWASGQATATASGSRGGLVGASDPSGNSDVTASFWDLDKSGLAASDGGTGLTSEQMLQRVNFSGWDFNAIWAQYDGHSTPLLRSLLTPLTVSVARGAAPTKVYDGTRSVADGVASYTVNGEAGMPDRSLLLGTLSAALDSANAGSRSVVQSGLYSTSQQGYLISYAPATVTVTPAPLSIAAASDSKVYNGNLNSAGKPTVSGLKAGDSATETVQAFVSRDALGTGSSTLAVIGFTISDGNGGANYAVTKTTAAGTITPAPLTLAAVSDSKVYDGSTLSSAKPLVPAGLAAGDSVTGLVQAFQSRNVMGAGASTLAVSAYTVNDGQGGQNYAVSTATAPGTVTPAALRITAVSDTKVYDGTTRSTAVPFVDGLMPGDTAAAGAQMFTSKNVLGTGGSTLVASPGGVNDGNGGANYTIAFTSATGTITPAPLTVSAIGQDKVYDGNTFAGVSLRSNAAVGDSLALTLSSASFADRNAGAAKPVSVTGIAFAGADAANYTLASTTASTTATITPAVLTLQATSDSKVYDGSTLSTAVPTVSAGLLAGDTLTGATQAFASRNVLGAGASSLVVQTATVSDGNNGANYTVQGLPASGTITPATLTIAAVSDSKVYDGGTRSGGVPVATGLLAADSLVGATQAFASRNVLGAGASTLVVQAATVNDGNNGANYSVLTLPASGTITPAALSIAAVSDSKVYDGGTLSAAAPTVAGLLGGDTADASQVFASRQVLGTGASRLQVAGYTVHDGNGGANYRVDGSASAAGTITPAPLVVSGLSAQAKVYDGTATSTVAGSPKVNPLGGDEVGVSGTLQASFADPRAGTAKAVSVAGLVLSGADAGNYQLAASQGLVADISPAGLAVGGLSAADKVYDGNTNAVLLGTARVTPLGNDAVAVSSAAVGSFADAGVGSGKPVSVSGLQLTGADAGNYRLLPLTGLQASITPATLQYVATPAELLLGQSLASLTGTVTGLVGTDTLAGATSGTVQWQASATASSPAGQYAINGSGLQAANYRFVQAPGNATALNLRPGADASPNVVGEQIASLMPLLREATAQAPALPGAAPGRSPVRVLDIGVRLPAGAYAP